MSKVKLQQMLSENLGLRKPVFKLEKIGSKIAGSIISDTFRGKSDRVRQKIIRDVLDAELGASSALEVGTLLAYTPDEWNVELPAKAG
jgi:acid stress-induced BolA-like protein IbaG/YrbA